MLKINNCLSLVMGMSEVDKCINETCFRWAIAVCRDVKREFWHCFNVCLSVHMVRQEITEDKCHELCLEVVLRKYNFSKNAIKECLIS